MSGDFEPEQKRYLEGFMAGLQIAKTSRTAAGNGAAAPPANAVAAEPIGPDAAALRAQDRTIKAGGKLSDPEKFKRELHPFDGYEKLKDQAAKNEAPKADDNFRWRFFGLFYCAPTQKVLYVPAAHRQRHSFALAVRRRRRSRRALCRRLCPRDHARQSADARGRAQKRRRHGRGDPGSGLKLARLRRRQYPQRHRHADRGDRSAGADRYPALCPRMAFPHPQRPLALRHPAQVQCRLRRRRADPGAGRHQRHRLPGRRGEGRLRRRAGHLVQAHARRHHRPSGFRPRYRRHRQARRRHQGGRRRGARLHRQRRPHQPRQGAAQIRPRRLGL